MNSDTGGAATKAAEQGPDQVFKGIEAPSKTFDEDKGQIDDRFEEKMRMMRELRSSRMHAQADVMEVGGK